MSMRAVIPVPAQATAQVGQPGRKRVTSRAELEQAAFALFAARGFDATTVDEIAAAGVPEAELPAYARALSALSESHMITERTHV